MDRKSLFALWAREAVSGLRRWANILELWRAEGRESSRNRQTCVHRVPGRAPEPGEHGCEAVFGWMKTVRSPRSRLGVCVNEDGFGVGFGKRVMVDGLVDPLPAWRIGAALRSPHELPVARAPGRCVSSQSRRFRRWGTRSASRVGRWGRWGDRLPTWVA